MVTCRISGGMHGQLGIHEQRRCPEGGGGGGDSGNICGHRHIGVLFLYVQQWYGNIWPVQSPHILTFCLAGYRITQSILILWRNHVLRLWWCNLYVIWTTSFCIYFFDITRCIRVQLSQIQCTTLHQVPDIMYGTWCTIGRYLCHLGGVFFPCTNNTRHRLRISRQKHWMIKITFDSFEYVYFTIAFQVLAIGIVQLLSI